MFRATMCPSSGAVDCVVLSPRVGIVPWLQEGCQNRLAGSVSIVDNTQVVLRTTQWTHYLLTGSDSLPATTAQYQHVAITLLSRQFLKMGKWLPETCRATCKGEIKDYTKVTSSWFLIHNELRCTVNHTSDWILSTDFRKSHNNFSMGVGFFFSCRQADGQTWRN